MRVERLRDVYNAQPFRPFVMHLADGRPLPVAHRDLIKSVLSRRIVIVVQPDDTANIVDLLLVTDIKLKPSSKISRKRRPA
jgi:hypothetical protein